VQRADGDFETFKTYEPIDIDEFSIRDLHASRPRPDLIVVRYQIATPDATSLKRGTIGDSEFAPRLTSFRLNPKTNQWLELSHANFNVPIQQICNYSAPLAVEPVDKFDADPAKAKLVTSLLVRLTEEVRSAGKAIPQADGLIMAETGIVSGDGYSRSGAKGARRYQAAGSTQRRNLFFTLGEKDLVVRFETKYQSAFDGVAFTDTWQPNLATFTLDPSGQWKLASFALFNYPAVPPAGVKCRRDG